MLCIMLPAVAQVSVKGIVQDKTGEPLIGATVQEKGNVANGTATGIDGDFALKVKSDKATLVVSYVGMRTQGGRSQRAHRHHNHPSGRC